MKTILLLAVLVALASAANLNQKDGKSLAPKKSGSYLRYIPFFQAPKRTGGSSTILKVENDLCDLENHDDLLDCDGLETYLVCYPEKGTVSSSCQCLGLDRVLDDVYEDLNDEEKVWVDAAKVIANTLGASPVTSFDKATGKCTGDNGTVCAFSPLSTDGLRVEAKKYIDSINNFKCSSGLECQQYSRENAHLGICRSVQPKPVESFSPPTTKTIPKRTILQGRERTGNFKQCAQPPYNQTEFQECATLGSHLVCYDRKCQCVGIKVYLAEEERNANWSPWDPDLESLGQIEAVRHVLKGLNATAESSYNSLLDECLMEVGSLCPVSTFPREGLDPKVQEVIDSANRFQCGCGLTCKHYGGPDPYIGTCQLAQ